MAIFSALTAVRASRRRRGGVHTTTQSNLDLDLVEAFAWVGLILLGCGVLFAMFYSIALSVILFAMRVVDFLI